MLIIGIIYFFPFDSFTLGQLAEVVTFESDSSPSLSEFSCSGVNYSDCHQPLLDFQKKYAVSFVIIISLIHTKYFSVCTSVQDQHLLNSKESIHNNDCRWMFTI